MDNCTQRDRLCQDRHRSWSCILRHSRSSSTFAPSHLYNTTSLCAGMPRQRMPQPQWPCCTRTCGSASALWHPRSPCTAPRANNTFLRQSIHHRLGQRHRHHQRRRLRVCQRHLRDQPHRSHIALQYTRWKNRGRNRELLAVRIVTP